MINSKLFYKCVKSFGSARFLNVCGCNCNKESLYRSNIYKGIDKKISEDSSEIINLSNDSKSINIPKSNNNAELPKFYFENETFQVAVNERGTIDLSPSMHANLPQPPNEAVKIHERPYDSIVSLGEGYTRNDKFISEELIDAHKSDNICHTRYFLSEERKLWLYCSNEKRFNIKISSNAPELISQGCLNVDTALDYQRDTMRQINKYWLIKMGLTEEKSYLVLFLPFSPDDDAEIHIESFIELYGLLNIDGKHEDILRYRNGELSYSDLVDKVDVVVREIVDHWYGNMIK